MAERNDMTAALVTAYTSPQLAAINEYLEAEKAVRVAAEILGLDADLMIAEAEGWHGLRHFQTWRPFISWQIKPPAESGR